MKDFFRFQLLTLSFLLILLTNASSQMSKEEAFGKFIEKYGNLNSISVQFKMPDNPGITGQLKAKSGNKYLMQIAGRIVICNGKTIWNYSKEDNSVAISNFEDSGNEMSIEDFFFSFIKAAKPISLVKETASNGINGMALKLAPEKKKKGDIIKDVKIVFQPDTYKILLIIANTTAGAHTWQIEHFQANAKLSDTMFEFKEPKNVKIIDLR